MTRAITLSPDRVSITWNHCQTGGSTYIGNDGQTYRLERVMGDKSVARNEKTGKTTILKGLGKSELLHRFHQELAQGEVGPYDIPEFF